MNIKFKKCKKVCKEAEYFIYVSEEQTLKIKYVKLILVVNIKEKEEWFDFMPQKEKICK